MKTKKMNTMLNLHKSKLKTMMSKSNLAKVKIISCGPFSLMSSSKFTVPVTLVTIFSDAKNIHFRYKNEAYNLKINTNCMFDMCKKKNLITM